MVHTQDAPADLQLANHPELQLIIEQVATGEITAEEARLKLSPILKKASEESALRKFLRELFPSLLR